MKKALSKICGTVDSHVWNRIFSGTDCWQVSVLREKRQIVLNSSISKF